MSAADGVACAGRGWYRSVECRGAEESPGVQGADGLRGGRTWPGPGSIIFVSPMSVCDKKCTYEALQSLF